MSAVTALSIIFAVLIFPGFIFTGVVGMLSSWIDRKVTARVQWRVGPPLLQPLYDFMKLLGKETIVPEGNRMFPFLLAPVIGVTAVTVVSFILWLPILDWEFLAGLSFSGDIILVIYLLMIPSLCVIIGGTSTRNPLGSLGSSREMKLIMGYELPFILAIVVPIIHMIVSPDFRAAEIRELLSLDYLVTFQNDHGAAVMSLSGVCALLAAILCMQAKLTLIPFDIPEAETEIIAGPYTDYSGPPLALYKLMRNMMLFVVPMTLVVFLCGAMNFNGIWSSIASILKLVGLLVVVTLMRNTNPRLRIDQAIKFFWTVPLLLALAGIVLASYGW